MARTIDQILAPHDVTREDVDAIFARFDADGSGKLEREEMRALAAMLARRLPQTDGGDLLEIMDFYEINRDGAFSKDELLDFLKIQMDM